MGNLPNLWAEVERLIEAAGYSTSDVRMVHIRPHVVLVEVFVPDPDVGSITVQFPCDPPDVAAA